MTALDTLLPFDRLCGTYVAERSDLPCLDGWTTAAASYDLPAIVATAWRSFDWEAAQSRDKAEAPGLPLMRPVWPHADRFRAPGEHGLRRRHAAARAD